MMGFANSQNHMIFFAKLGMGTAVSAPAALGRCDAARLRIGPSRPERDA
jgi:hypothetical protein